ncbi:hypothetical protein R1flu_020681 [Riccia fluitans]|uniref:RING-type domain-containing protein n=1 Tax=Riccia fluitans TaxID=41844 RepID=A0ABD1ZM69_9MARC
MVYGSGGEASGWSCAVCTYLNDIDQDMCPLCFHTRAYTHQLAMLSQLTDHTALASQSSISGFNFSRIFHGAVTGAVTGMFAIVGAFTGAVTGAFAGRSSDNGLLRGAGLGALAGAVLSVEVLDATRAYWASERSASSAAASLAEFLEDILSGRFVQEQLSPALLTAHRWQVNTDEMSYDELYEMFGSGLPAVKGASKASLDELPTHVVNSDNGKDVSGECICCAICLQELQQGEVARSLPPCQHTFHQNCVDRWLSQHGSCPVCRHDI